MIPRQYRRPVQRLQKHLPKILSIVGGLALIGGVYSGYKSHITSVAAENAIEYDTVVSLIDLGDKPSPVFDVYETPKIVNLKIGEEVTSELTFVATLNDFLIEKNIEVGEFDEVFPTRELPLSQQNDVEIIRVQKETYTVEGAIAFKTKETENSNVEEGITTVKQEGKNGKISRTYEKTLKNGVYVGEKLIAETVLEQPQDKIIEVGTKLVPKTETINGVTITYYKKMWVKATSYDGSCAGCNGTTATGRTLDYGIIAADPSVIPWHTKMYVPGYGFGQMEDTGGALKRATSRGYTLIDLGFKDISKGWWSTRYTWIYLLVN